MRKDTCLLLTNSQSNLESLTQVIKDNEFKVVVVNTIVEFVQTLGYYRPECILIDVESFIAEDVVSLVINTDVSYLRQSIILTDKHYEGYTCVTYNRLSYLLKEKKKYLQEKNLNRYTEAQLFCASGVVKEKLLELGFRPKYHGFEMLTEIVVYCGMCDQYGTMYKSVLPAIADKFETSVSNITHCVRKSINTRETTSDIYPYPNASLKQIVKYINEILNPQFLEIMQN